MKRASLTLRIALLCLLASNTIINAQERVRPYSTADLKKSERSAAGLKVKGGVTPEALIRDVFIGGNCFEVKNIKYSGDSACIGTFEGGKTGINIDKGIIMTTGNIVTAEPPNNKSDYSFANPAITDDVDLKKLINNAQAIHDQSIIEFDFTPTANTIQFRFVFASEEYCEYVNSAYNDVFGFFISGPGINGTFSNNAKNIALIPNTNSFVSINNVNHQSYSSYFVNNIHQFSPVTACSGIWSLGKFLKEVGYDGFTKVLTATANVQPCQTYHIKLAIADVKDHSFDSAVFLQANSFNSGNNAYVEANIPQTISADKQTVYEGCDSTAVTFTRLDSDDSKPVTIKFNVDNSGTAIQSVDYEPLPNQITIPAGAMNYRLPIKVINDNIKEPDETIVLKVETSCTCEETKVVLKIRDNPSFTMSVIDTAFCGNLPVTITSKVSGGIGKLNYLWSNGVTQPQINVQPGISTSFKLTVKDACGVELIDDAQVTIAEPPIASLPTANVEVCRVGQKAKLPLTLNGVPPFTISYILNGKTQTQVINQTQTFLNIDTIGFLQLKSVSTGSCKGLVSGAVSIGLNPITLSGFTTDLKCFGTKTGAIDLNIAGGGTPPYQFKWSNDDSAEDPKGLAAGQYSVTVTDPDACRAIYSATLGEPKELKTQVVQSNAVNCENLMGGIIKVNALGGIAPYEFVWDNGRKGAFQENLAPGMYKYTVTDANSCGTIYEAQVKSDTVKPKDLNFEVVQPDCRTLFGTIYIKSATGGVGPYTYKIDSSFSSNKIFSKLIPNTYALTVRGSNGCTNTWNAKVPIYEEPEVSLSPLDTIILPGDSVTLIATHNVPGNILKGISWDPDYHLDCTNCTTVLAKPLTSTVFTIKVKDKFDCEATASARIKFNRNVNIYVPNVMNITSDYVQNRKLAVYGNARQVKKINVFMVYDRWGTEVYRSNDMLLNDQREGWDGYLRNSEVAPGAYIYFTEILLHDGEIIRKSGDVTVVR